MPFGPIATLPSRIRSLFLIDTHLPLGNLETINDTANAISTLPLVPERKMPRKLATADESAKSSCIKLAPGGPKNRDRNLKVSALGVLSTSCSYLFSRPRPTVSPWDFGV
jgi:hypothetical protein